MTLLMGMMVSAFAADGTAGYNKGYVIADGENFKMKIGGRVQPRFVFEGNDDFSDNDMAFEVTRARLKFGGHVWDPNLKYLIQLDAGKGFVSLKDYYVDYMVTENVAVRTGQFKKYASRQQLASTDSIHLIERSITDKEFDYGRDTGILLVRELKKSGGLEWGVGLYNGNGDKGRFSGDTTVDVTTGEGEVTGKFNNVPDVFGPLAVARIGYGTLGNWKENDLEGGALRWHAGGGVMANFDADDNDDGLVVANIDYIVKAHGFSHTGAFYMGMDQHGTAFTDQALTRTAFHAQAGYVIGGKVEPAVRYAMVMPTDGDATTEMGGGVNVYWRQHNWKWQTDVVRVETAGVSSTLARSQVQLKF
jgi:phosphate-selective porin OprO and OprP